jgi:hypothetical protein
LRLTIVKISRPEWTALNAVFMNLLRFARHRLPLRDFPRSMPCQSTAAGNLLGREIPFDHHNRNNLLNSFHSIADP